jgi:hypothetical protein
VADHRRRRRPISLSRDSACHRSHGGTDVSILNLNVPVASVPALKRKGTTMKIKTKVRAGRECGGPLPIGD